MVLPIYSIIMFAGAHEVFNYPIISLDIYHTWV
jgi:hypothetical protein